MPERISPYCRIYTSVNWTSTDSGNGLSPVRRQAITWTNADVLSIGPSGTNFSEISIKIQHFPFTNMHLDISSAIDRYMAAILSRGDGLITSATLPPGAKTDTEESDQHPTHERTRRNWNLSHNRTHFLPRESIPCNWRYPWMKTAISTSCSIHCNRHSSQKLITYEGFSKNVWPLKSKRSLNFNVP